MPLVFHNLGEILTRIYDFPLGGGIYFPEMDAYEATTCCIVAWAEIDEGEDEVSLHQACLKQGFKKWLNVAVVSDTCDQVTERTQEEMVLAFNADCVEGGWLARMMNYWRPDESVTET